MCSCCVDHGKRIVDKADLSLPSWILPSKAFTYRGHMPLAVKTIVG